ncbi:amino acid ABC transporter membrane protein 2 (PAAT family) [Paraburkholderia sp. BL27I4N3]|uniref:amino acid ABC transporter permease n=1 Tax=Paraburkholderia sp. BL27I4N3 TaxID=1938805 RepID=UPI000E2689B2|nr:amino acid ABC transporter permease [Paraburkholderia sp. BL27I4N3]REE18145.1 amino acid ABC transporter membrane protein 2 (PAAT family) [Paraburkholderia sp. BL27I4N3]
MSEILNLWAQWLPSLLGGLKISVEVTIACLVLGIPLGLLLAVCVGSPSRVLRTVAVVFIEIGRGAPALILLQFLYFGLPTTGLTLSSFASSVLALALNAGAYTSEIMRAGLLSVPFGQREAAFAIGLSPRDSFRLIVLPQGLRVAIPPLLGYALLILQATSLCFTVALPELVSRANDIGSSTFRYMPVLVLTGLLYACICVPSTLMIGRMERHFSRHE